MAVARGLKNTELLMSGVRYIHGLMLEQFVNSDSLALHWSIQPGVSDGCLRLPCVCLNIQTAMFASLRIETAMCVSQHIV